MGLSMVLLGGVGVGVLGGLCICVGYGWGVGRGFCFDGWLFCFVLYCCVVMCFFLLFLLNVDFFLSFGFFGLFVLRFLIYVLGIV